MIEFVASIAQLGERQTEDLKVSGSIPEGGKFFFFSLRIRLSMRETKMSLWRNGYRFPLLRGRLRVRIPPETIQSNKCARLAQSVERTTLNRVVAGSSPAVGILSNIFVTSKRR